MHLLQGALDFAADRHKAATYHGQEYLNDGKNHNPHGQAKGGACVFPESMTCILVQKSHTSASCHTVDNVQPNHDN